MGDVGIVGMMKCSAVHPHQLPFPAEIGRAGLAGPWVLSSTATAIHWFGRLRLHAG